MKILFHICCANCAIYPFLRMKEEGIEAVGFFFNPNVHPYQEYRKRIETVRFYSEKAGLEVRYRDEYLLEEFLRNVALQPAERCRYCYTVRLRAAAEEAKRTRLDGFSTTLLYSVYQKHPLIKETGERVSGEVGIPFYYEDFRPGWRRGVEISKGMGLYRQQYCGCIYSEKERYATSETMSNAQAQNSNGIRMPNDKAQSPNEIPIPNVKDRDLNKQKYDLEERTAKFGEAIIAFVRTLEKNKVNDSLISQLMRSGTGIGANYMEADGAESKKDFYHKIGLCLKESKETKHWLRMVSKANPQRDVDCRNLWQEVQELTLIFSSILRSKGK